MEKIVLNPVIWAKENFLLDFQILITNISKSKGNIIVEIETRDVEKSRYHSIVLVSSYISKLNNYDKKVSVNIIDYEKICVSFSIEEITQNFHYSFYELILVFNIDGKEYHIPATGVDSIFKKRYLKIRKYYLNKKKNRVVFPTLGYYDFLNFFVDDRKKIDNFFHTHMEYLIAGIHRRRLFKEQKNKVLLFEKDLEYAQDNSFALFQWVQENKTKNNYYYIINKNAKQVDKLLPYKKKIIYSGSFRYYWHILTAGLLISSETPSNAYLDNNRKYATQFVKKLLYKKKNFMLQHGVIAFKKLGTDVDPVMNAKSGIIDYFVSSNVEEQKIIIENLNYSSEKVPILGLTRWDKFLKNKLNTNNYGNILYVPTWRQWLFNLSDDEFLMSDYYLEINNLLTDEFLIQFLKEKDLKLDVYLHPFMQRFVNDFNIENKYIHLLSSDKYDLSILINNAAMLITDYSSVAWDFAIQRKPVVFYQFDRERYEEEIGSYINLNNMIIGSSFETTENVVLEVLKIINNDFQLSLQVMNNIEILFGNLYDNISYKTYQFIESRILGGNRNWKQKTLK
ncbi:MAG: CDP-glycerol glycerophosphotransferase family protein [Lactobacillales bacterium]|jgi:CDP-glycerol glycerophosphotransferase (TagB/SpsB family)|nr:CDP-glycerol glycerophosphotransferase family protein [Lactobacillales bacterium]